MADINPISAEPTRAKRIAQAFESVFGQAGRRSNDAKLVLDYIRQFSSQESPIFEVDKEGRFDPLRAAHRDGARTIFLMIERQLALAKSKPTPVKK